MMPEPRPRLFTPKLVLGLALIGLGLVLTFDQLGWPGAWRAFQFWPLVPALFGLARLRQRGWTHLGGHIWLGVALVGLATETRHGELLDRWWPLLLVWAGLVIALRAFWPPRPKNDCHSCDPGTSVPRAPHEPLP